MLRLPTTKNGRPLLIPMSAAIEDTLRRRQADFQQPRAQRGLSGDERGAAGGAALLPVVVGEAGARGGFDDGFLTDRQAAGDEGIGQGEFEALDHHAVVHIVAGEFFAHDDAAFLFEFLVREEHVLGDIREEKEAFFQEGFGGFREFQFINGFLEGGVGIGVGPEGHAEPLEELDHFVSREMGGAIEGHVLKEVGEALLVVLFHEGTRPDIEAGTDLFGGFAVGKDGVADAVGQAAELGFGVRLEVAAVLRPVGGGIEGDGWGGQGAFGILGMQDGGQAGEEEQKQQWAGEFHGKWE